MSAHPTRRKAADEPISKTVVRPQIWVDGRPRPGFDLVAFARVSGAMAGRALAPAIDNAAARLSALAQRVQRGDLRLSRPIAQRMALLGVMLLFAWPSGAVRAMMYHLDGGDLRDWS